jgi:hypothetical protein
VIEDRRSPTVASSPRLRVEAPEGPLNRIRILEGIHNCFVGDSVRLSELSGLGSEGRKGLSAPRNPCLRRVTK